MKPLWITLIVIGALMIIAPGLVFVKAQVDGTGRPENLMTLIGVIVVGIVLLAVADGIRRKSK